MGHYQYCMQHVGVLQQLENPRRLEDEAYERLRAALRSGAFAPGERLSAEALSKELGVSRMPVVQALRRLASEGFVTMEAHKPVRVADPTAAEIRERYLVIQALERVCVREAFARDPEAVIRLLQEQLAGGTDSPGSALEDDERDRAFHEVVWHASGLPSVAGMLKTLWDHGGYYRSLLFAHGEYRKSRLAEHRAIVAAAEARDVDAVIERLEEHRARGMARMLAIVGKRSDVLG
jgi:DNA-binding GntR family transcriptional regulator